MRTRTLFALAFMLTAFLLTPHLVLAQTVPPSIPDNTVSVVQLWMVAFGILVTLIGSFMRSAQFVAWPDLYKRLTVAFISAILAAIGLAVQNNLIPETFIRATLTILVVASAIYALLWKPVQDNLAGLKTIAVKKDDLTLVKANAPSGAVVDPGK